MKKAGVFLSKDHIEKKKNLQKIDIDGTLPHQVSSPSFKGTGMKMEAPFVNEHGVVIGDSYYNSPQSPLNQWSKDTDPEIMAGDEWVHPTNDIGWNTAENIELLEKKIKPNAGQFQHPTKDTSFGQD
jgi:hypothetical protein